MLFFDEAHLLFDDAPKTLIDKVEQVVRLIRSKSVGVYFVTQNPTDVPDSVLAQLGNRAQHALRAFTARDQKAVKAAATTFRANPAFSTEQAITELAVGEALVSMLEEKGTPGVVQRTLIAPPRSRVGPAPATERQAAARRRARWPAATRSPSTGRAPTRSCRPAPRHRRQRQRRRCRPPGGGTARTTRGRRPPPGIAETLASSAARSIGSKLGREIVRGVLGSLFRGR